MQQDETDGPDELDRRKKKHFVGWLLLVASTTTLLTNAYYFQFLEPSVSRKSLALVLIGVTAAWFYISKVGIPRPNTSWVLAAILAVAFVLRYQGAGSGLPQSYIPDEYDYVHSYLQMIKRGDLNPHWWHHPSVQPYVNVVAYLVMFYPQVPSGKWSTVQQLQVEDVLLWGRVAAGVIPGTLAVLVAFFLGRRLFGAGVGLLGAAVLAVATGVVEVSQYNKPDALLVLFVSLSVLATLAYLDVGTKRLAFAAGAVVGLTVATKYNGALVLLPFLAAVLFRHGLKFVQRPDIYLGAAGTVTGFVVGCPYFYADFQRFLDHVAAGLYNYGYVGLEGAMGVDNWYNHAVYTIRYGTGPWPFLFGILGLLIALYRIDRRIAVFLTYPVLYYSFYSSQKILFAGNLVPVYPFLAILAAYGVSETAAFVGRMASKRIALPQSVAEKTAAALLIVLVLWFPWSLSRYRNHMVTLPDTGTLAAEWIESRFPEGTHFGIERHTPVLDPRRYQLTRESRVINVSVDHLREAGVQYLIVSSTVYGRFGPENRQSRRYRELFERCHLVKEFAPEEGRIMGPTIRILEIPAG